MGYHISEMHYLTSGANAQKKKFHTIIGCIIYEHASGFLESRAGLVWNFVYSGMKPMHVSYFKKT